MWQTIQTNLLPYTFKFIIALFVFGIGLWIGRFVTTCASRALQARRVDLTIQRFMKHLVYALMMILLAILILAILGVESNALFAVLGASFFAIAFALKNSLSSLASGILLILFRPFKIGDYVSIHGFEGTVDEIQLMYTKMKANDHQTIVVPNDQFTRDAFVNVWESPMRRYDLVIGVDYQSDPNQVRQILMDILDQESRIIKMPHPPYVGVQALAHGAIHFIIQYWSLRQDFVSLQSDLLVRAKMRFDQEGIHPPSLYYGGPLFDRKLS